MFQTFFFFSSRRRHTRFKCDWSSDVCSSDLDDDANIIFGAVIDEQMGDEVRITVIATGFGSQDRVREPMRAVESVERPDARRAGVVRELTKDSPRRVVKLGTIIDDGGDARFVPSEKGDPASGDSQYDVPT